MGKDIIKKVFFRFSIVLFWLSVISVFLFSPKIIKKCFYCQKSLHILTFPQMIDANYVHAFEKETGIKLHINYYENNDALLVKMRKAGGRGYDIIFPSDYAVEILAKEGLLKKIDKSRLSFFENIDKKFLNKYFDPDNSYSIPYVWEAYKIGVHKDFCKQNSFEPSWKLLFDEDFCCSHDAIGMNNNPREAILLAAFYLFGSIDNLDGEKIEEIKELLTKQKTWVEAYTDLRSDYLLSSQSCPLAVGTSGEIWHATRFNKDLDFLIPKEGTFVIIDSIALSSKSKHEDLAYTFINYLCAPEAISYHIEKYSLFPVIQNVTMSQYFAESMEKVWNEAEKIDFFRNVLTEEQLNTIWIELKSN